MGAQPLPSSQLLRVVVIGNSLNMAGIAASLRANPDLEVMNLYGFSTISWQYLRRISPSVIVFDLTAPSASMDISLLHERPDLLLIGVDPSSDDLMVLSWRPQPACSVADLIAIIRHKESDPDLPHKI